MAVENSSALLDMKDDEDQDLPPDGAESTAPLIMEHGYDIAVKVDAPMKQLSTLETYVTYRVRCVCARWPTPPSVRRRYNHFKALHARLCAAHWQLAPPPPPPAHSPRQQLDRYAARLLRRRAAALHAFCDRIAKHPILTHSEDFRQFLTLPDDELERVFRSDSGVMNLWGLSVYGGADRPSATGARVKDPEFAAAAEYLLSLRLKLTALHSLTDRLYAAGAALGREYDNLAQSPPPAPAFGAVLAAAGAAGAARRGRCAPRAGVLPFLAAYAHALAAKIRERDALHAAHVAGAAAPGDIHNKLEQASEAVRAELADWAPKTRADVRAALLDVADHQVQIHTQTAAAWERALRCVTRADPAALFETVSRAAVRNLSPASCQPPPPDAVSDATAAELSDSDLQSLTLNGDVEADARQSDVDTCRGDVDTCHGDVNARDACHGDVDSYHGDVDTCHGDVDTCHGDVDTCHGDVETCHGDVDTCRGDVDTCHGDVEARRSGVEAEVAAALSESPDESGDVTAAGDPLRGFADVDLTSDSCQPPEET